VDSDQTSLAINNYLKAAVASCCLKLPAAPGGGRRAASRGRSEMKQRGAKKRAMLDIKTSLKVKRQKKMVTTPANTNKCPSKAKNMAPFKGNPKRT